MEFFNILYGNMKIYGIFKAKRMNIGFGRSKIGNKSLRGIMDFIFLKHNARIYKIYRHYYKEETVIFLSQIIKYLDQKIV